MRLRLLVIALVLPQIAAAASLNVGDVLGTANADDAKELLPPEIVKHYAAGEYRNPIVDYPLANNRWEPSFLAATEQNGRDLAVNDAGSIVSAATGKPPAYVYGFPFPNVEPSDPRAATKIIWNQFFAYWARGSTFNETRVTMLQPKGIDRDIFANGWFKFYEGQSEKYRSPNPMNLQSQFLGVSTYPADLQGTASLTWRYRDADKRDSVWAYVPALRRVRAVSPANRSDGYLGSDISGDDGFFFDGKPEDFTWELVGKRDALRVVDPQSVAGPLKPEPAPGGGWTTLVNDNPKMVGFEDKTWTGLSWAPISAGLARRPVWVIRGRPKDRYYLYGSLELWIDAVTWDGAWNRKFDWKGELVHAYQTMARVNHAAGPENDPEYINVSTQVWACAENFKLKRATLGGMRARPGAAFVGRAPVSSDLFASQRLVQYGK